MKIQISLSTKCNINCKFCLRRVLKEKFNFSENVDMDITIVKKMLEWKSLTKIFICGNKGEALFHPEIDNILKCIKKKGIIIDFTTNAYYKPTQWWSDLGKLFESRDVVTFFLDGIGNRVHQLHRGSDFYTVLKNIETFINSGGHAIWKFIRFKHNQHQVELGRELAKAIGCSDFILLNSHTYDSKLKEPTDSKLKVWTEKNIGDKEQTTSDYLPCENKTYYINTRGLIFPCCFIANTFSHKPMRIIHSEKQLVALFYKDMKLLDLRNNNIEYIVSNSKFFQECLKKTSLLCKSSCLKWTRNQNKEIRG